jgi:endonuclease III
MMEHKNDVLSSATQTWPKSTPPYETFKSLKQELQADAEIANAMSYMDHPTLNSSDKQVKNMMRELCDVLEELRDLGQNKKKVESLEETFGPMTFLRRPSKAVKKEAKKPVEPEELEPKDDPVRYMFL